MKPLIILATLVLAACSQPLVRQAANPAATFAERVAKAEALEATPEGLAYVTRIVDAHGERIHGYVGECYADSPLEKDSFTLVADVATDGSMKNVDVQPDSVASACYAEKFAAVAVSEARAEGYADQPFPLVINITYTAGTGAPAPATAR